MTNPALLVEILSPSTEDYDRGKKAKLYRAIPSLQELLLIAQDSYEVELCRRQADGSWSLMEAKGLGSGDRADIHRVHVILAGTLREGFWGLGKGLTQIHWRDSQEEKGKRAKTGALLTPRLDFAGYELTS